MSFNMKCFSRRKLQQLFVTLVTVSLVYFGLVIYIAKDQFIRRTSSQHFKDLYIEVNRTNVSKNIALYFGLQRNPSEVGKAFFNSSNDLYKKSSQFAINPYFTLVNGSTIHVNQSDQIAGDIDELRNTEFINETKDVQKIYNDPKTRGLQVHFWRGLFPSLQALCNHPLFPKGPSKRYVLTKFQLRYNENYFGQRIFGYLHPSSSGLHIFAVASDDNSAVWLREKDSKVEAVKICCVNSSEPVWTAVDEFDKYSTQKSKPIYLEKSKMYYIEVLHIQLSSNDFVQVVWLQPGAKKFSVIDFKSTSLIESAKLSGNGTIVRRNLFRSEACKGITEYHHLQKGSALKVKKHSYVEHKELENALPVCPYRPEYLNRGGPLPKGKWYSIFKYNVETYSYPWVDYQNVTPIVGLHSLESAEALNIVKEYVQNVEKACSGVYRLGSILQVEKKLDRDKGVRYLVELNVTKDDNHPCIISEYIYKNETSKELCYPDNLQWQRDAHIALILSVRNQEAWMRHFLDNLEDIYAITGEQNVSLIVFDYSSTDIDIDREISLRRLPPCTIIKQPGVYSRSHSLNAAVKAVKDPNAIIFTLDLHLEIPSTIFDDVRKHCFEGRSIYTPVIVRLRPGHTPLNPHGYWEQQGFGLMAMYKSDWDRVGGLDEENFKNKWGGEDWDLLERAVGNGLEYERIRNFKMFHYHHSRKGMWTGDADIQNEKDPFSNK